MILQTKKECYACGTIENLHCHHIFYGTANRKKSEKYGLKVWLCMEHHTGAAGVHRDRDFDLHLKRFAQFYFEKNIGTRADFRREFGKSFL